MGRLLQAFAASAALCAPLAALAAEPKAVVQGDVDGELKDLVQRVIGETDRPIAALIAVLCGCIALVAWMRLAAQQARDTAAELLHLYAQRAAREGHRFDFKTHDLEAFADGFGFEETPDQRAAIGASLA